MHFWKMLKSLTCYQVKHIQSTNSISEILGSVQTNASCSFISPQSLSNHSIWPEKTPSQEPHRVSDAKWSDSSSLSSIHQTYRKIEVNKTDRFCRERRFYLVSMAFLQASANFANCFLASPVNLGLTTFIGTSFMISFRSTGDIIPSGLSQNGNNGSMPFRSLIFCSKSHL